jgi:multidrug efflux pump subunit AcrA (membrane-fusion protein)
LDQSIPENFWRRHALHLTLAGVLAALLVWTLWPGSGRLRVARSEVQIGTVEHTEFGRSVRASGVLEPEKQSKVTARSPGEVVEVLVSPGSKVQVGDALLRLSNPQLLQEAKSARLALRQAELKNASLLLELQTSELELDAEITRLRSELKIAQMQDRGESELADKGVISRQQYLQTQGKTAQLAALLTLNEAKSTRLTELHRLKRTAEQALLEEQREQTELSQQQLAALLVRAELEGTVESMEVSLGESVQAGQMLAQIAQQGVLRARLRVAPGQARLLRAGMVMSVRAAQRDLPGELLSIAPTVREGMVEVLAKLDESQGADVLRSGQSIEANISMESAQPTLTVARPSFAVGEHSPAQFFQVSGSVARPVTIQIGRLSADRAEVLEGATAGTQLILSDLSQRTSANGDAELELY